tara:strand:- start:497 stop:1006 length:510 start_codon:yes stop_codon:yes gene_type:complete
MFERFFGKRKKEDPTETTEIEPASSPAEPAEAVDLSALQTFTCERENEKTERRTEIEAAAGASGETVDKEELKGRITDMIKTIFDPEIPVNIYDIGLIYEINPQDSGIVHVKMTLTSPNCPAAGILPGEVESKTRSVDGVKDCELELTFDPPWNPDMMSEAAKLELGML